MCAVRLWRRHGVNAGSKQSFKPVGAARARLAFLFLFLQAGAADLGASLSLASSSDQT